MLNLNDARTRSTFAGQSAPIGAATHASSDIPIFDESDALLDLARDAGMLVILDAQIGREKYQSVVGTPASLLRLAAILSCRLRECDTV
jgi:hypothetical protein